MYDTGRFTNYTTAFLAMFVDTITIIMRLIVEIAITALKGLYLIRNYNCVNIQDLV